jgi:hypothetical protein
MNNSNSIKNKIVSTFIRTMINPLFIGSESQLLLQILLSFMDFRLIHLIEISCICYKRMAGNKSNCL